MSRTAKAGAATIAILPLGAHEQHGPHLPFETDAIIAEAVVERACGLRENLSLHCLAVETTGYSPEHMDFAGSKTLAFDEAIHRWVDIGLALKEQGISKLLIVNAHGGNSPLMSIVATELRVRANMLCAATSWTRFIAPGLVSADEKAFGIHGGQIETSVMLAVRPDLVDMSKARDFISQQAEYAGRFKHLRAYGPHAFGWKMADLNPEGVTGNAGLATAELGEKLLAMAAGGIAELLDDMAGFNPDWLDA
ncbi:MAG: creatininase family protein [Nitratireductor sp.]